jgi:hypothetical protein
VTVVRFADGRVERFGSECINKILGSDQSLRRLFEKNRKLTAQYAHWLDVLNRDPERMPRGGEYYGSGLYFISDDHGSDIMGNGRYVFHPTPDWDKNQGGDRYVQTCSHNEYRAQKLADVTRMIAWLQSEQERIGKFLARLIAKGIASSA